MAHRCLTDALAEAAARRCALVFLDGQGAVAARRPWADLLDAGARRGALLAAEGVRPGEVVLLMGDTTEALVETLLGVGWLGAVPVLLAPRRGKEHQRFIGAVARQASARMLLVGASVMDRSGDYLSAFGELVRPIPEETPAVAPTVRGPTNDTAWLQFSSGSTRTPRGVVVTQSCLVSNLAAIASNAGVVSGDRLVSWLPLFHDMGIVGGLFGPPAWLIEGVLFDPGTFAYRPALWLRAMSELRGTLGVAPNFAFELCAQRVDDAELEGVRLDSWRFAWSGSEMVLAETVRRFEQRFAKFGLRSNVILPCYGAAEATLKIASRRGGEPLLVERLCVEALSRNEIRAAAPGEKTAEITSVGRPIPGTQVRILDDSGRPVAERTIGEIEVSGPSVCPGYLGAPDPDLSGGRWLTGDLGFFADGELFVTGRKKELLIVNGRNIYPHDMEKAAVEAAPGVIRRAAAFAVPDREAGTERAVLALELERPGSLGEELHDKVRLAAGGVAGTSRVTIWVVPFIPTTTSGKLQRTRVRDSYLAAAEEART